MWLNTRMFLLVAFLFGILYGVITGVGTWIGAGSALIYIIIAFAFLGIKYLIAPAIVARTMKIKWVSEKETPDLHKMVAELAERARLPKPKVGISQLAIPNAFSLRMMGGGAVGGRREGGGVAALVGIGSLILYLITNLLVLYGSRIREYCADRGSIELGNEPRYLATALYKLVYANARFKGREELKQVEVVKAFFL